MDNQKSNEGSARNIGSEGSGSSMGKDMSKDMGSYGRDSGAGKSTSGMDTTVDKSATDMHKSIDKAAEAVQPMADRLASSAHAGVDKVADALTGVTGRMDEKTKQLGEAYNKFAETGRDYVRTSPATSVLVALGAGFVLSKLFSGRRH
jgi:ElaB/YqjD/DUF883 family membrane-anchored ribosome-binding protein